MIALVMLHNLGNQGINPEIPKFLQCKPVIKNRHIRTNGVIISCISIDEKFIVAVGTAIKMYASTATNVSNIQSIFVNTVKNEFKQIIHPFLLCKEILEIKLLGINPKKEDA